MLTDAIDAYLADVNDKIAERAELAAESRRVLALMRERHGIEPRSLVEDVAMLEAQLRELATKRERAQRLRIGAALGVPGMLRPTAA